MPGTEVFPTLLCCTRLERAYNNFDIKFWPYAIADNDQIFALCGERDILIGRPKLDADPPYEILRWWQDADPEAMHNSVIWTKDPVTKKPWVCVAGSRPRHIKILDVESGEVVRSLTGHGRAINDLAIHPHSTNILASASEDYSVRLWNLDPKYAKQPCVAMFCGEGHRQPLLACHFHPNGKWLLTGAMDTAVALWRVPDLAQLHDEHATDQEPMIVYYPHFFSTEVHYGYVDCLAFYGDLIISRAAKDQDHKNLQNEILLWEIDGFDSEMAEPAHPPIPSPGIYTRSSFPHDPRQRGFKRLLTFSNAHSESFYLRFGFLNKADMRPILVFGNFKTRVSFWDLQKLEEGYTDAEKFKKPGRKSKGLMSRMSSDNSLGQLNRVREESVASEATGSNAAATPQPSSTSISAPPERKYDLSDPFKPLEPHRSQVIHTDLPVGVSGAQKGKPSHFGVRQWAWSPDGTWLLGAGDLGMLVIFHRDRSVV